MNDRTTAAIDTMKDLFDTLNEQLGTLLNEGGSWQQNTEIKFRQRFRECLAEKLIDDGRTSGAVQWDEDVNDLQEWALNAATSIQVTIGDFDDEVIDYCATNFSNLVVRIYWGIEDDLVRQTLLSQMSFTLDF